MSIPVAAAGDPIIHGDGTTGVIVSAKEKNVKVQNMDIATLGDTCSLHGGVIEETRNSTVYAEGVLVVVKGDTVKCPDLPGTIQPPESRTVFIGNLSLDE